MQKYEFERAISNYLHQKNTLIVITLWNINRNIYKSSYFGCSMKNSYFCVINNKNNH